MSRRHIKGFTLVEILVAVALMALLTGLTVLAVRTPAAASATDYAQRCRGLMLALRSDAVFSGRPIALSWHRDVPVLFDATSAGWETRGTTPGSNLRLPDSVRIVLQVDGQAVSLDEPEPIPHILFTTDAQISPFQLRITDDNGGETLLDSSLQLRELQ